MSEKIKMQVGDIIATYHYSGANILGKVDRVTESSAWVGKDRFDREYLPDWPFYLYGDSSKFKTRSYQVVSYDEAQKIRAKNAHLKNMARIQDADLSKLSPEQALAIVNILAAADALKKQ